MVSLGARPWGTYLKAPVAVAVVLLAVAAWKTSCPKAENADGADGERSLPPPSSGSTSTGSTSSGNSSSIGKTSATGNSCGCECHSKGVNRRRRSHSGESKSNGTHSGGGGGGGTNSSNTQGDGPERGRGKNGTGRPAHRCCSCPAAIAATAAATALGRRSGSVRSAALAGTPRRGRNDRRVEPNAGIGRQRRSRPRDGSSSSDKAGGGAPSQAGFTRQNSAGHGKRGGGGAGGSTGSAGAATPVAVVEGATVESLAVLGRMCHFPGVILRSGLFFQRVTSLSLPGQGIADGDVPASVVRLAGALRKVDLSGNKLTAVPSGMLGLGPGLEDLNLGNNNIAELPPEIAQLGGLVYFNLAGNRLTRLTPEIGKLSALKRLGLKGNALVRLPASLGDLSHLVELYLTGNILEALPDEIVKLRRLKKLQMSFNNLRSLPQGMEAMRSLELCRIAVNPGLAVVPEGLKFAERLSWVSLAGSAWCARATEKRRRSSFPVIPREEVVLGERLGSGASGDVFAGVYRGQDVAVKVFKSDVGPDGNARDELDVACAVDHPNLTKSLGVVRASNAENTSGLSGGGANGVPAAAARGGTGGGGGGGIENLRWLVMERVVGQPLAEKPDFSSVLRCRWGSGRRFEPILVLAVLLQVARAMSYLHEKSICHGDLYAHNVLVDGETGAAVLCDFGASFFYPSDRHDSSVLEGTEVRAFGLMARDMACRSAGCEWILQDLVPSCLQTDTNHRPSFHEIINQLHAELMQSVEPSSPMVTSAKSLHSLLDRPDIAAERGRLRSTERRLDYSSSSSRGGGQATDGGGGGGDGGGIGNNTTTSGNGVGRGVDLVGGTIDGVMDGVVTYNRGGGGGAGGRGRGGAGGTVGGRPLVRLGEVQEGTADDEGGDDDGGGGEGGQKAAPGEGGAVSVSAAAAAAAAAVPVGTVVVPTGAGAGAGNGVLVSVE
eukprot:g18482.t1